MIKPIKFLAGVAAVAMFAACSSEEPALGGDNATTGGGQKAYLSVRINSTGDMGRATDFDTPSYEDGDASEHHVDNATFLFFDGAGKLTYTVSANGISGSTSNSENIEWIAGQNVLVLEEVQQKGYPRYMMTLLNYSGNLPESGSSLAQVSQMLSLYADNFNATKSNFVMSTSSYYTTTANDSYHNNTYYCVTRLDETDFFDTAEAAVNDDNAVRVYVERLAAKVQVDVKASSKTFNGEKYYLTTQTIGGGDNDQGGSIDNILTADTPLYVKVSNWALNATAVDSYVSKQFDSAWEATAPFANWNNSSFFRSFWGMSRAYGETNVSDLVNYITPYELTHSNALGAAQYCYENTTTANIAFKNIAAEGETANYQPDSRYLTHVVLSTELYIEKDGKMENVKGVMWRGSLFIEDTFKAYVLNSLKNSSDGLNYWIKVDKENYRQLDVNDITLVGVGGTIGKATIQVAQNEDGNYPELYTYNEGAADGSKFTSTTVKALQDRLTAFQGTTKIDYYVKNIYYIPIEHYAANGRVGEEGYYGVVRNHWYKLDINKFSRVGHAVYDPDNKTDKIIPDTPENPLYFVGAKINILSWRLINQTVEL